MTMMEMGIHGHTQKEIGEFFGVSTDTVNRELTRATRNGWAEEMRQKLRKQALEGPDVHTEIMGTPVEELQKNSRGYKLKLDARNSLLSGLGAFKNETHSTKETLSLTAIAAEMRGPEEEVTGPGKYFDSSRVVFKPEDVEDGEIIPDKQLSE